MAGNKKHNLMTGKRNGGISEKGKKTIKSLQFFNLTSYFIFALPKKFIYDIQNKAKFFLHRLININIQVTFHIF